MTGLIWPFAVTPARHLLELHPAHRTAHGGLLKDIINVLVGSPAPAQIRRTSRTARRPQPQRTARAALPAQ
jgi:hypothetical protein